MDKINTHKDLNVYKKAMDFVVLIYKTTKKFPSDEKFGLISQLRRAAVSIPSNIAEGAARKNTKEFIQFLYHSLGSASEIETQIELAKRLNFIDNTKEIDKALHEIIYLLTALIKSLKNKLTDKKRC